MTRLMIATIAAFALSAPAHGQNSVYLQVDGGASIPADNELAGLDLEYETGFVWGGRLGVQTTDSLRLEISGAYTENDIDQLGGVAITQSSVWIFDTAVGGYFDLPISPTFDAYLGAGGGLHYKELDDPLVEDDDVSLSLHGEVGISFDVSPTFAIVPHYRLTWFDDFFEDEQFHNWIRVGLRFTP